MEDISSRELIFNKPQIRSISNSPTAKQFYFLLLDQFHKDNKLIEFTINLSPIYGQFKICVQRKARFPKDMKTCEYQSSGKPITLNSEMLKDIEKDEFLGIMVSS